MSRAWGSAGLLLALVACGGKDESDLSAAHASAAAASGEAGRERSQAGEAAAVAQAGSAGQGMDAGMPLAVAGHVGGAGGAGASMDAEDAGPAMDAAAQPAKMKEPDTSDEVFRDDRLSTYTLTIASADWDTLQKTALDEQYVPAMLEVDGQAIGKIGVRYKGSYTLTSCFEDGKQVCRKVSMKLKFDEYESSLRYHGLKRLNFHSALNDHSLLHERVSYKLFRDFGVLAPRSVHARLMINGSYAGLFDLTEEVDGRFVDRNFSGQEDNGTLYKEVWPGSSQSADYFTQGEQTNEGAPVTKILSFAQQLAAAKSSTLGQVVSHWMDVDSTLRYLAVHTAIKHWDGPLTFWCSAEHGCVNHNYYLYESPAQERLTFIAWDMDNTFYDDTLTDMAQVPQWWEPADECIRDGSKQFMAPACDRMVQGFNLLGHDKFRATMARLLSGPYQVAAMQADVDRWSMQIDEAVKTDPHSSGYEDWKANVAGLRAAIATFRTRAEAVRDGK